MFLKHTVRLRPRYKETDQMGVVYYSNYLVWFEIGRTDLLRDLGLNYKDVEEKGALLPVLKCECNYKSPAKYDDILIINTRISELKKVGMSFTYEIIRPSDNKLIADGMTKHVFLDKNGKILRIGDNLLDILS